VALTTAAVTIAVPRTAANRPPPRPKQAEEDTDATTASAMRDERFMRPLKTPSGNVAIRASVCKSLSDAGLLYFFALYDGAP
jgi:hypothetical protein